MSHGNSSLGKRFTWLSEQPRCRATRISCGEGMVEGNRMNEKSLLLDPTAAVQEAHNDLIANGTIAVVSAGRVARAQGRISASHGYRRHKRHYTATRFERAKMETTPAGCPRAGASRPPVSPLRNRRAALVENHVAPTVPTPRPRIGWSGCRRCRFSAASPPPPAPPVSRRA